jgi:hypothetical protein
MAEPFIADADDAIGRVWCVLFHLFTGFLIPMLKLLLKNKETDK